MVLLVIARCRHHWRAIVILGSALVLAVACGGGSADEVTAAGEAAAESRVPSEGEHAGILARERQATTWTDEGLFVYGGLDPQVRVQGGDPLGGAALVDPRTGAVTALPEPPLGAPLDIGAVAATVGSDVLLFGRRCDTVVLTGDTSTCEPGDPAGALYSLGDGSWRGLDVPDEVRDAALASGSNWGAHLLGVTSDGRVVLELVLEGQRAAGEAPFWTYRVETSEWTHLPDPGVSIDDSCLAGDQIVVNTSVPAEDLSVSAVELVVLSLDTADAVWDRTAALRGTVWPYTPRMSCGTEVAVVHGVAYGHPTAVAFLHSVAGPSQVGWVELPPLPEEFSPTEGVWTGHQLVLIGVDGSAVALDPEAGSVEPIDLGSPQPRTTPAWTGDGLVVIDQTAPDGITLRDLV